MSRGPECNDAGRLVEISLSGKYLGRRMQNLLKSFPLWFEGGTFVIDCDRNIITCLGPSYLSVMHHLYVQQVQNDQLTAFLCNCVF